MREFGAKWLKVLENLINSVSQCRGPLSVMERDENHASHFRLDTNTQEDRRLLPIPSVRALSNAKLSFRR